VRTGDLHLAGQDEDGLVDHTAGLVDDVDVALGEKVEETEEEKRERKKAVARAKLRAAGRGSGATMALARASGVDMHREGSWWSEAASLKKKGPSSRVGTSPGFCRWNTLRGS